MAWYLKTPGGGGSGGASSVEDLTDVTISNPGLGQVLALTGPTGWKNLPSGVVLEVDVPANTSQVNVSFSDYDSFPSEFRNYTYLPEPIMYTSVKGLAPYSVEWTSIDPVPPKRITGVQLKFVPQSEAFEAYVILPLPPDMYYLPST